jgi:lysophospholipase L1-like esterase
MGNVMARIKRLMTAFQTGWSIAGITLLILLFLEAGLRLTFALRDRLGAPESPDRRILAEGYGGATWPIEHYREIESLEERWEPYVYFRPKPFHGKTIAIGPDGLRATWQPTAASGEAAGKKTVKVLVLGGSSLWGFGARDDQTIPSLLARKLHERGLKFEIKNLAELGYVSTQELIGLTRELQEGYRPDVVIFYDGVNDTTSALLSGEAGLTTNEINRQREFNLLQSPRRLAAVLVEKLVVDSGLYRFARAVRSRLGPPTAPPSSRVPDDSMRHLAGLVADRYSANVKIVEILARGYGFRPLFFWQPTIFNKTTLTAVERDESQKYAWTERAFRTVYERVSESNELKSNPAFHDLSRIFVDEKSLVFVDYCHTTETANARLAEQMAAAVFSPRE